MWHSVFKANEFGVDFVEDFLKYLEKEQVRTGDNQLIYRLLNYTYDPVRKTTFLDELKITGLEPDLDVIKMISQKKYGAKSYKDLTEDDLKKGYYPEKNQVAKK
jgi:hypothetical protein